MIGNTWNPAGLFSKLNPQKLQSGVADNSGMLGMLGAGLLAHRQNASNPIVDPRLLMAGQEADQVREKQKKLDEQQNWSARWLMDKDPTLTEEDAMGIVSNPTMMAAHLKGTVYPDPIETKDNRTADERNWALYNSLDPKDQSEFIQFRKAGTPAGEGLKLTEAQSKDLGFLGRAVNAEPDMEAFETALLDPVQHAAMNAPGGIGNYALSPEFQQAWQAKVAFTSAVVRKDSGAALTAADMRYAEQTFIPVPGDSPETIEQKRQARQDWMATQELSLGNARELATPIRQRADDKRARPRKKFDKRTPRDDEFNDEDVEVLGIEEGT